MTQEALKLALEALEGFYEYGYDRQECFEHITAIKEALAQEQEPVALPCCGYTNPEAIKWNTHNQVVQCHNCGQVYTHSPQRTWVGLTDEEIDSYFEDHGWSPSKDYYPVIKAIEAKLRSKNGY